MSTINERLEAAAVRAETASSIANQWAQGPVNTTILTESGPLPTLAEFMRQNAEAITDATAFPAELADPDSDKLIGGVQAGVLVKSTVSILSYGGKDDNTANNLSAFSAAFTALNAVGGGKLHLPKVSAGIYFINGDDTTPVTAPVEITADEGVSIRLIYSGGVNNSPLNNRELLKFSRQIKITLSNFGFNVYTPSHAHRKASDNLPSLQGKNGVYSKPILLSGSDFKVIDFASPNAEVTPISTSSDAVVFDAASSTVAAVRRSNIGEEVFSMVRNPAASLHFAGVSTLGGYVYYVQNSANAEVTLRDANAGSATIVVGVPYPILNQQRDLFNFSLMSVRVISDRLFSVLCNGLVVGTYSTRSNITGVMFGTENGTENTAVSYSSVVAGNAAGGSTPVRVICCGDSISDNNVQYSPFRYMSSIVQSAGLQISELNNLAVAGETSGQQLARLLSTGVGYNYTLIQVGVNDIQGAVPLTTFYNNIVAMCNHAKTNGSVPIVGIPSQFYSLAEAVSNGQSGGQNTANNELGYQYRAVAIRAAASVGALVNVQTIKNMGAISAQFLDLVAAGVQIDPVMTDNIHPTPYGAMMLGLSWAESLWGAINGADTASIEQAELVPASWLRNGFGVTSRPSIKEYRLFGYVYFDGEAAPEAAAFMQVPPQMRRTSKFVVPVSALNAAGEPIGLANISIETDGNIKAYSLPANTKQLAFNGIAI